MKEYSNSFQSLMFSGVITKERGVALVKADKYRLVIKKGDDTVLGNEETISIDRKRVLLAHLLDQRNMGLVFLVDEPDIRTDFNLVPIGRGNFVGEYQAEVYGRPSPARLF